VASAWPLPTSGWRDDPRSEPVGRGRAWCPARRLSGQWCVPLCGRLCACFPADAYGAGGSDGTWPAHSRRWNGNRPTGRAQDRRRRRRRVRNAACRTLVSGLHHAALARVLVGVPARLVVLPVQRVSARQKKLLKHLGGDGGHPFAVVGRSSALPALASCCLRPRRPEHRAARGLAPAYGSRAEDTAAWPTRGLVAAGDGQLVRIGRRGSPWCCAICTARRRSARVDRRVPAAAARPARAGSVRLRAAGSLVSPSRTRPGRTWSSPGSAPRAVRPSMRASIGAARSGSAAMCRASVSRSWAPARCCRPAPRPPRRSARWRSSCARLAPASRAARSQSSTAAHLSRPGRPHQRLDTGLGTVQPSSPPH